MCLSLHSLYQSLCEWAVDRQALDHHCHLEREGGEREGGREGRGRERKRGGYVTLITVSKCQGSCMCTVTVNSSQEKLHIQYIIQYTTIILIHTIYYTYNILL